MNAFSYRNWMNFTFSNEIHHSSQGHFSVRLGRPASYKTLLDELEDAAIEFAESAKNAGKKVGLLFSGGVDSEMIARALLSAEIDFDAFFLQFSNELNTEEMNDAEEIAEQLGFVLHKVAVDPYKDIVEPYPVLAESKSLIGLSSHLYFLARDRISADYALIRGEGEPRLRRERDGNWYHSFSSQGHLRMLQLADPLDAPCFYVYTPELYFSYLYDPDVKERLDIPGVQILEAQKIKVFRKKGIETKIRPKRTGFEGIEKQTETSSVKLWIYRMPY